MSLPLPISNGSTYPRRSSILQGLFLAFYRNVRTMMRMSSRCHNCSKTKNLSNALLKTVDNEQSAIIKIPAILGATPPFIQVLQHLQTYPLLTLSCSDVGRIDNDGHGNLCSTPCPATPLFRRGKARWICHHLCRTTATFTLRSMSS